MAEREQRQKEFRAPRSEAYRARTGTRVHRVRPPRGRQKDLAIQESLEAWGFEDPEEAVDAEA